MDVMVLGASILRLNFHLELLLLMSSSLGLIGSISKHGWVHRPPLS